MEITVREIDEHSIQSVNQCDSTFIVDAQLVLNAENGKINYTIIDVPRYEKHYPPEKLDYKTYVGNPDRTIFFAEVGNRLAGQIIVRKYWNAYAYIDNICVEPRFRKQGVGQALIQRVIDWAKEKRFPGIMLETQNNNVGACRLYESCGFELAGFDRFLYKGLHPNTEEIALYWYLVFEK